MLHYYLVKLKCVFKCVLTPMLLRRGDRAGNGRVFMESTGDWYSFGLARSGELAHRASFSCKTHTQVHVNPGEIFPTGILSGLKVT